MRHGTCTAGSLYIVK